MNQSSFSIFLRHMKKANKRNNRKDEDAPVMSTPIEKTTLGDIEELAALKEKLSGK